MLNLHQESVLRAQLRTLHHAIHTKADVHPISSSLTALMRHGGLYTLLDPDIMAARMGSVAVDSAGRARLAGLVPNLQAAVGSFFSRLVPDQPYIIPSSLMSHIAFPHEGAAYTSDRDEKEHPSKYVSPEIPAVFTFVGQFIDHDLTMNAVNLFEPQEDPIFPTPPGAAPIPNPIVDGASPLIDLDSVYGPRAKLGAPLNALYEGDKFRLVSANGITDLPRDADGTATIADKRNDENQLILQIHLLVQRMHNKFVEDGASFEEARRQTIYNWQFMMLNDYLPRIIQAETLTFVLTQIGLPDFGELKHKPCRDLATGMLRVSMPHEFAIGFRFGHSQLKRGYKLNNSYPEGSLLFDNSLVGTGPDGTGYDDLRGGRTLRAKNHIEWPTFFASSAPVLSNRIDRKVTARVFDLPESAIPDDIKYIGNLPHRNLIRSRQVGLCSGEALAKFYGIAAMAPEQIEPAASKRDFYEQNERRQPGELRIFETPLWYYILREAELTNGPGPNASKLGPLGSRLVAEVIVGAIAYAPLSVAKDPSWKSTIPGALSDPGAPSDHLRNIIRCVNDLSAF